MNIIDIYNYKLNADVLHVIDGDTIQVLTHFENFSIKQTVRLNRIDTPEKFGKYKIIGLAVKQFVNNIIRNYNNKIIIHAIKKDMYGRVIAEVFFHDNTNLNDILIQNKVCKSCYGKRNEWNTQELNEVFKQLQFLNYIKHDLDFMQILALE